MFVGHVRNLVAFLTVFGMACTMSSVVWGQGGVGNGGGAGGGNGGGGDGAGGGQDTNLGGIEIDARGVLSRRAVIDRAGVINKSRMEAAKASLNRDVQTKSPLRMISLNRLENELKALVASGKPIPEEMKNLAGLTQITHVFYYPETKDIVIAGPAEGFFATANNNVIGIESGKSVLQLQDLVVALRAFGPNNTDTRVISCSIDPTKEGSVRLKQATAQVQQTLNSGGAIDTAQVLNFYKEALGMQEISIKGVSRKTNFARVMVEADYRMKMIGLGLERPAVPVTTFAEKITPQMVSKNSMVRWFFQPDYDCITISPEGDAIQFTGGGVRLIGEDELVNQQGDRQVTGGVNKASKVYCDSFTKMYDKLALADPIWAELKNVMDLSIAAAFIQKSQLFEKAAWSMDFFGDELKFRTEVINPPTHVAPVASAIYKGNQLMTPIAGGISLQPRIALNSDKVKTDSSGAISESKNQGAEKLLDLKKGQWWWD